MKWLQILLVLLICGCAQGTGTGNPNHASEGGNSGGGIVESTETDLILVGTCAKIVACHGLGREDEVNCKGHLYWQTTFDEALGLGNTTPLAASQIALLEAKGQITANEAVAADCRDQIRRVACDSAAVQAAYVAGEDDPYAAAADLLSDTCKDVFRR